MDEEFPWDEVQATRPHPERVAVLENGGRVPVDQASAHYGTLESYASHPNTEWEVLYYLRRLCFGQPIEPEYMRAYPRGFAGPRRRPGSPDEGRGLVRRPGRGGVHCASSRRSPTRPTGRCRSFSPHGITCAVF